MALVLHSKLVNIALLRGINTAAILYKWDFVWSVNKCGKQGCHTIVKRACGFIRKYVEFVTRTRTGHISKVDCINITIMFLLVVVLLKKGILQFCRVKNR